MIVYDDENGFWVDTSKPIEDDGGNILYEECNPAEVVSELEQELTQLRDRHERALEYCRQRMVPSRSQEKRIAVQSGMPSEAVYQKHRMAHALVRILEGTDQ